MKLHDYLGVLRPPVTHLPSAAIFSHLPSAVAKSLLPPLSKATPSAQVFSFVRSCHGGSNATRRPRLRSEVEVSRLTSG